MKLKYFLTFLLLGLLSNAYAQKWAEVFETGGSYLEVKKAFYDEWKDKPYVRSSGYKPFKRFENFYEDRLYPEYKWPNPMQVWNEYHAVAGKMPVSTNQWQPVGPTSWTDGAGWNAGLGRINVIYVDPNNPSIIYVGAPAGGLWKSTDGGSSWTCLTDDQPVLGVSDMEIDPNNSNVIYLATGDGDASDTYSVGVIKSTNGGLTWNTTGLNFQVTQTRRIRRLIMHPTDANILFAATTNGLYRTTNGGTSWTQINTNNYQDLAFKPGDPTTVYAVNDKFYKSTNGGTSFTQITAGLPPDNEVNRYKIGVSADEPNYVYIVCGKQGDSTFKGMYRSTNSGTSFSLQANSPNIFGYSQDGSDSAGQSWYDLAIVVDPNDANTMWVGGVNIWKSTDGGVTYFPQTHWIYPNNNGYTHADIHYLQMYNGSIYVGSDGGVFISSDGGNTWTDKTLGIQITQFYRISTSQSNPDKVIGGTQDNGTNLYGGSLNWTHVVGADGMECIINPSNDNIVYACIQNGSIRKSTNGGNTFTAMFNPGQVNETAAWVTPYVLDPDNLDHIYVGYTELYKSTNAGGSFTQISNLNNSTPLNHIHIAEADSDVIYLGRKQNVLKSTNGGVTFSTVTGNLPNKNITGIITDPTDANRVWVSISGYLGGSKVYYSSTGGGSWTNLSTGLPNIPANCLMYRPGSNDEIYVGTDVGVYYLTGNAGSWQLFGLGLPNVVVRDLEYTGGVERMRAGTYGRGLWEIDLPDNCLTDIAPPTINCPNSVPVYYPTPSNTCDQLVTLPPSTATDNCDNNPDLSWRFIETDISGVPLSGAVYSPYYTASNYTFDVGYYTIDWKAEDDSGNSTNCDYQIEIRDVFDPQPNCINEVALLDAMGQVQVTVGQVSSGPADNCAISQVVLGTSQLDCADLGPNNINVLALDVNGNSASCNAVLTVADQLVPEAICVPSLTVGLNNGSVTISTAQIDAGSYDNCSIVSSSIDQTTFGCADLGLNIVTLEVFDQSGNSNTCVTELIVESFLPVVAICQDITVFLNDVGTVVVDPVQVDNGSSSDCGTIAFSLDMDTFDCADLGPNDVILTVSDGLGGSETCTAVITVEDAIPPFIQCVNSTTLSVDINGEVQVDAASLVSSVFENCSVSYVSNPADFDCSVMGSNSVEVTATDPSGNTGTCNTTITITDDIAPEAVCIPALTITLNADGTYNLTTDEVDDGSLDNCGLISSSLSSSVFDCDDIGTNTLTLFVVDPSGNSASCDFDLTVADGSVPEMQCQDVSIALDDQGVAVITPNDINNGSLVACGSITYSIDVSTFECTDLGPNTVVLTGTSDTGASESCSSIVTIVDDLAPVVSCQNTINFSLDINGDLTINTTDIFDQLTDNCDANPILALDQTTFNCSDLGSTSVVLTATDSEQNSSSCTSAITIVDDLSPVLVCSDLTLELDSTDQIIVHANQIVTTASDNCDLNPTLFPAAISFNCDDIGQNSIEITATDASGNGTLCEANILVTPNTTPIANCVDAVTVNLDENGSGSIDVSDVDAGSYTGCESVQLSLDITEFDCSHVGVDQEVTLLASNNSGGQATCTAIITVVDDLAPILECTSIEIELDNNGAYVVTPEELLASASDNCSNITFTSSSVLMDCDSIGFKIIEVVGEDDSGNVTSCLGFVTVSENIPPVAICMDIEVELDADGMVALDPNEIAGASQDNCGSVSLEIVGEDTFDCAVSGTVQTISILVEDTSENVAACEASISFVDNISPNAVCQSAEVFIQGGGMVELDPIQFDGGSDDNCTGLQFSVAPASFNCDDLGTQTITLTATDEGGNSDDCSVDITISDNDNPIAECADNTTVELEDDGNLTLDIDDVYAGSGLSCNGVDYFIEPADFDCTDIGFPTLVTLGLVGANNDTTSCSTTLSVLDVTKPEAVCETVDVALTNGSELTLFPETLAGNSSDVCSDSIYYQLDSLVLTCEDIGTSIIPIIVVDISGNFDTCSATIHLINEAEPIAVCNDTDTYLDENGDASISLDDVTSNATDACGNEVNVALSLSQTTFNCEDVGLPQEVELEVVDQNNGNSATCLSLVTVLDTLPPVITSVIDTVPFVYDGVETVSFSGGNFNVMHTDNCDPGNFVVKRNTGACGDGLFNPFIEFCVEDLDGIYPVTLRQFDGNGNYVDIIVYVELDNLLVATNEIKINAPDIFCTPNPFMESTVLNIQLEEHTDIQINVYALDGKTVFSSNRKLESGDHNIPIDLEGQSSGLYICHVQSLHWETSIKLIKGK